MGFHQPPPPTDMGIWDFSKFGLSIKSWKLVSTNPSPPPPPFWTWEFGILANLDLVNFLGIGKCANHFEPRPGAPRSWGFRFRFYTMWIDLRLRKRYAPGARTERAPLRPRRLGVSGHSGQPCSISSAEKYKPFIINLIFTRHPLYINFKILCKDRSEQESGGLWVPL